MVRNYMTADELYQRTMEHVAPLPCQEEYARNLAELFSYHQKKNYLMDAGFPSECLPYQSAIVVAPSGQGKSFLMKEMAKICKTNVVLVNGDALSHEGWRGVSLSQQLLAAKKSVEDIDEFERSIILIDEVDKLRNWGTEHDQGGAQENLLKLFDGAPIIAEGPNREIEAFDSSRFTVILAGAFAGMEEIIKDRINCKSSIGFCTSEKENGVQVTSAEAMKQVTQQDLVKYGMMNELIGRIGSIICIDPMKAEDYRQLLTAENGSICSRYANYFSTLYGVEFAMAEEGIQTIADKCMNSSTGARAINPMINDLLREAMSEVDRDQNINKVILDADNGECCVKYEYGERTYSYLAKHERMDELGASVDSGGDQSPYMLKATSDLEMVNKICGIYGETDGNPNVIKELNAYLKCTICYLKEFTNPEDFCFASLFKLAKACRKPDLFIESTYDIMMGDAIQNKSRCGKLEEYYNAYKEVFTLYTPHKIMTALNKINQRMQEEYCSTEIFFEIRREK